MAPDRYAAQPLPRHPNGDVNWQHSSSRRRLALYLTQGVGAPTIAQKLGIGQRAVYHALVSLGLNQPPEGYIYLSEAATALDMSQSGARDLMLRSGVSLRPWGGRMALREAKLERVLQEEGRQRLVSKRPEGYVTMEDLMDVWQLSKTNVIRRLSTAKIKPRFILKRGTARTGLYDRRDVAAAAPPVSPARCPAGHVTPEELARLTGRVPSAVRWWIERGCPHVPGRNNREYFRPEAVLAWLETQTHHYPRKAAATLRANLAAEAAEKGRAA